MSIPEELSAVMSNIALAAQRSGRRADEIVLVGATKMNDAARIQHAISAGLRVCGENRVQELLEKNAQHAYDGAPCFFAGGR